MNDEPPKKSRLGRMQKLLLLAVLSLAVLVSIDTLFRVYLALTGGAWSPAQIRDSIHEIESTVGDMTPMPEVKDQPDERTVGGGGTVLHPYAGFEIRGSLLQVPAERLRTGTEEDQETYDIAVLGGSVAGRFVSLSAESFERVLQQDPRFAGRKIRIVGFARGGYKQPQQLLQFAYLLVCGIRPDAVINIDGFNETALGNDNANHSVFPLYPSWSHWLFAVKSGGLSPEQLQNLYLLMKVREKITKTARLSRRVRLDWSAALGNLALARIRKCQRDYSIAYDRYLKTIAGGKQLVTDEGLAGPKFRRRSKDEQALDLVTESWVETSLQIDAICRLHSILYLHVLQPTLFDDGAKPITDEERQKSIGAESWITGAKAGYPMLRAAAPRLLEAGVHFHDSSRLFADVHESIYFDVCHFEGIGNVMFGEDVARAFLAAVPPQ